MNVCVVSHRLGGFDGVSIEAGKWVGALRSLGIRVTRAAGCFEDSEPGDVLVVGMWADRPGEDPPPVDHATIARLCRSHDLLILDNAGSLWSAPRATAAWEQHALDAGIPTLVRHHDVIWQDLAHLRCPRRDPAEMLPLHDPNHLHIVINQRTRKDFVERWPALARAEAIETVRNHIDTEELARGDRTSTRASLGVRPDEIVLAHPARVESKRKNIPGAVRFSLSLADKISRPVRYWLTDPSPATSESVQHALTQAPGLIRGLVPRQADLYAAADVVLLPSIWEGWGLPVTEAAAAGKLIVAGPYPILDEIRELGVTVYEPSQIGKIADYLTGERPATELLRNNRRAVKDHLDLRRLPSTLHDLMIKARRLQPRNSFTARRSRHADPGM